MDWTVADALFFIILAGCLILFKSGIDKLADFLDEDSWETTNKKEID